MEIRGYLPTSAIEWPGKIAAIIFTGGCNFRCPFCHNSELVDVKKMIGLQDYSEQSIIDDLEKRKKWVEAVVITGGEPTLQPDLEEFLCKIKKMGFLIMIETNGSRPEVLAKLLALSGVERVDRIAMDIKGPFEKYGQIINFQLPIVNIKKSIEIILNSGVEYEFRTTIVPGIHNREVILEMAREIEQESERAREQGGLKTKDQRQKVVWHLQNFQPKNCLDPKFNKVKPYTEEEMKGFLKEVKNIIPQAKLR